MFTKLSVMLISFSLFSFNTKGQDTITLKNGLTIYGLITEVNNNEIKFRIDGGSITMDQIMSYSKSGKRTTLNNITPTQTQANKPEPPKDCEVKNVGDAEFENKTAYPMTVTIYAIGIVADGEYDKNNPVVNKLTIPSNGSATSYELTTGVHYFRYTDGGFTYASGQVRVTKCGVARYTIK